MAEQQKESAAVSKVDREKNRRRQLDAWRNVYKKNYANLDGETLAQHCRDKGVILWDDEAQDDEKLRDACREAGIALLEDTPIDPGDPVIIYATEAAFNPRFTECARYLRLLREELQGRGISSRAVLDQMILTEDPRWTKTTSN